MEGNVLILSDIARGPESVPHRLAPTAGPLFHGGDRAKEQPAQLGAHQRAFARLDIDDAASAAAPFARAHREHRRAQEVAVPRRGVAAGVATHAASSGTGSCRGHAGRGTCSTAARAGGASDHRHLGRRCPSKAAAWLVQAAHSDSRRVPARLWTFQCGGGLRGGRTAVSCSGSTGRRSAVGGAAPRGAPHSRGACGLFCRAGFPRGSRGAHSSIWTSSSRGR